jgi:EpsD family peptidyl-prolyl cis-trans isomerase
MVGACHKPAFLGGKPKAPTGQVVAVVDGHEITLRDLQTELGGAAPSDPKQQKALQQRALQILVLRQLLADAAIKQGLDKTPDFAVQKQKAIDNLLAQTLEANVAKGVPAPAPEEIDRFISANTDIFAQRKIWDVDQLRFARPSDPAVIRGLQPLNTIDDIATYLTGLHIPFTRAPASLDAVGMDPRLVAAIVKMPAGNVFVVPSGEGVLVNGIKATRVVPLSDADSKTYATALLKRQHTQEAVQRQMGLVISQGLKTQVQFNPAYAPPTPPPGAAAAAAGAATNGVAPAPGAPTKSVAAP